MVADKSHRRHIEEDIHPNKRVKLDQGEDARVARIEDIPMGMVEMVNGIGSSADDDVDGGSRLENGGLGVDSSSLAKRKRINYLDGLFLAPMVRCGTLPTRLLSLSYGADLVWGPEVVDKAIIGTTRAIDEDTGLVRFYRHKTPHAHCHSMEPTSIFETHPIEKPRFIFQMGSSDPELAVKAGKVVEKDVAGLDLNCGCPKSFSVSGGMGAALLTKPDKLCAILSALVDAFPHLPISAKIRLLPTSEDTLALVRRIVRTGISCLTVHCRTKEMRPENPATLERLREIVDLVREETNGRVAVVANGDCWGRTEAPKVKEVTGVTSVMIARGAEANASCFREEGLLDPELVVIPQYVRICLALQARVPHKYCIQCMSLSDSPIPQTSSRKSHQSKLKQSISKSKTLEHMAELFGLQEEEIEEARRMKLQDLLPGMVSWGKKMEARMVEEEVPRPLDALPKVATIERAESPHKEEMKTISKAQPDPPISPATIGTAAHLVQVAV